MAAAAPPPDSLEPPAPGAVPRAGRLAVLREAVGLGYFRGIMNQLDEIDAAEPACAAWTAGQRALARQFRFEAML